MHRKRTWRAFTLVEIMIVVSIAGTVAVLSIPAMTHSLGDARLAAVADEAIAAAAFAQFGAVANGRPMRVRIRAAQPQLAIAVEQWQSGADFSQATLAEAAVETETYTPALHPLRRGEDYVVSLELEQRHASVQITQSAFDLGSELVFDASGSPSHGGNVSLTGYGRQVVLTVNTSSGKMTR